MTRLRGGRGGASFIMPASELAGARLHLCARAPRRTNWATCASLVRLACSGRPANECARPQANNKFNFPPATLGRRLSRHSGPALFGRLAGCALSFFFASRSLARVSRRGLACATCQQLGRPALLPRANKLFARFFSFSPSLAADQTLERNHQVILRTREISATAFATTTTTTSSARVSDCSPPIDLAPNFIDDLLQVPPPARSPSCRWSGAPGARGSNGPPIEGKRPRSNECARAETLFN